MAEEDQERVTVNETAEQRQDRLLKESQAADAQRRRENRRGRRSFREVIEDLDREYKEDQARGVGLGAQYRNIGKTAKASRSWNWSRDVTPESVEEDLSTFSTKVTSAPRERVSRAQQARRTWSPYQHSEARKLVAAAGLGAILVLGALLSNAQSTQTQADLDGLSSQIDAAEVALGKARADGRAIPDPLTAKQQLAAADKAGTAMAKLQNDYIDQDEVSVESRGRSTVNRSDIHNSLARYFTEDSLPVESTDLDPATPWFLSSVDPHVINKSAKTGTDVVKWQFQKAQITEDGIIEAVWLCRDNKGNLLEWATSQYHVDEGKFYGLTRGKTAAGSEMIDSFVNREHGHDHTHEDGSEIDKHNEHIEEEGSGK